MAITDKERDTMIAALRLYQRHQSFPHNIPDEIVDIAMNGREGDGACLNADEIDQLIEDKINIPAAEIGN